MNCDHADYFPIQLALDRDFTGQPMDEFQTADWCANCGCVRLEGTKDWLEPNKTQ